MSCAIAHIIRPTFSSLRHGFLNSRIALSLTRVFYVGIRDERSHIFQTPTPLLFHALRLLLLLRLRKNLKHQLRLLFALRKLPSNSYWIDTVYFASWGKICRGYFSFDRTQYGWNGHVTSTIQRDTTCWGLKFWLSLFFTQRRQAQSLKAYPHLN